MADSIQEGTCLRCGMLGTHENNVACIYTLRDIIAVPLSAMRLCHVP